MGNSAEFVQGFHAAKNVFFWRFALEKLQNGHCQFTAHIVENLEIKEKYDLVSKSERK